MTSAISFGVKVVGSSGGEELCICPFHADKRPSAWFNPRRELFYCAVCNLGLSGVQVAKRLGFEVQDEYETEREPEDYDMVEDEMLIDLGDSIYTPYFVQRGIDKQTVVDFNLRWSGDKQAAVFPFQRLDGKFIGASYRFIDSPVRYKILGKRTPIWPMKLLLENVSKEVIVTEGAWSAMRLKQALQKHGLNCTCLALMGAKANNAIVDLLRPFRVTFLYDSDKAGKVACLRMRQIWPSARSYTLSVSPDDMIDSEFRVLFNRLAQTAS